MVLNPNLSEEIPGKKTLKGIISETPDEFTKNALSMVYPPKLVKRILFRPYIGKLFPYIDVEVPNHRTQLSFFYGRLNMRFSKERNCTICKTKFNEKPNGNKTEDYIPICLCKKCKEKVFYEYWECLNATIIKAVRKAKINTNQIGSERKIEEINTQQCKSFLDPRCGFPLESNYTNPCLENHGIALLMNSRRSLKLFAAPIEKLKYMMMWEGGIAGVILGYKRKIMNLELLEGWLSKIILIIKNEITKLNQQIASQKNPIIMLFPQIHLDETPKLTGGFQEWLVYTFLNYYKNLETQKYCRILINTPFFILKELLESITRKMEIDILKFISLVDRYPPLNFKLREELETNFNNALNIGKIESFKCSLMEKFHYSYDNEKGMHLIPINNGFFSSFLNQFCPISRIKLNRSKKSEDLEIYKILGSFGKRIIVDSSQSPRPVTLNLNEISGRYIY
mgnify:CR=1 FL=1